MLLAYDFRTGFDNPVIEKQKGYKQKLIKTVYLVFEQVNLKISKEVILIPPWKNANFLRESLV